MSWLPPTDKTLLLWRAFRTFRGQTAAKEHKPLIIKQGDRTPLLSASLSMLTNSHTYTCVSTRVHDTGESLLHKKKTTFSPWHFYPQKKISSFSLHFLLRYAPVDAGTRCITFLSLASRRQSHISLFYVHFQDFIRLSPTLQRKRNCF